MKWGHLKQIVAALLLGAGYVGGYFWLTTDFQVRCGLYVEVYERHFHWRGTQLAYRPVAWIESKLRGEQLIISSDGKAPSDFYDELKP
jgi:hypothetical protein